MFGCRHKFEPTIKDGYQFCKKCGKGVAVLSCSHTWVVKDKYNVATDFRASDVPHTVVYVLCCSKCGDFKKESVGVNDL